MAPRIVQWLPVEAFDELYLVPRRGNEDAFAQRARELGASVQLQSRRAEVYAPGTNIDGGWIDVGDELPVARFAEASIEELARAAAELIDVIEPTRFLVRDLDGTRAIHVAEDIELVDVVDWREHVANEHQHALLVAAVTEAIVARGAPRPDDLDDLEGLARLAPDELEPHTLLAQLYVQLERLEDADRAARAALALDVRPYRKAPAHAVLGEIATKRGELRVAWEEYAAAAAAHRTPRAQLALGVAAIRANEGLEAWKALAPRHSARTLFELAEAMCGMDRLDDAHAFLEVALDLDRTLLLPVPANQWPKPPDTAWTTPYPELAKLVVQAAGGVGG